MVRLGLYSTVINLMLRKQLPYVLCLKPLGNYVLPQRQLRR